MKTNSICKHIFDQFIIYILTGSGIFAFFRALLWIQGLRIVSFFRVYRHKKDFFNHPIFTKIDNIVRTNHFVANIKDLAKKELGQDMIFLEVFIIKQILKQNLKFIYKKNLIEYIKSFSDFRGDKITNLFIKEYLNYKQELIRYARRKLTKNNFMTQDDFNRFWLVYSEYTTVYEMLIYETLNIFSERKNIYAILWDILDHFDALVEIKIKTISHQLNIMNGRLSGIKYKGYVIE